MILLLLIKVKNAQPRILFLLPPNVVIVGNWIPRAGHFDCYRGRERKHKAWNSTYFFYITRSLLSYVNDSLTIIFFFYFKLSRMIGEW